MEFLFNVAKTPKIVFGAGNIQKLGSLCSEHGKSVILVTGGKSFENVNIAPAIEKTLRAANINWHRIIVSGEPSPQVIDDAVEDCKPKQFDLVVAVGGGSVLDAGKAISAMLCEPGGVKEYLEGVGHKTPSGKRLPLVAIPTTSGTGSEATKNAVISEFGPDGFKKSLRHDNYVPDVALIDPMLTLSCSPEQTAASGMDAFTQLLESYLSTTANPYTDALALSGLEAVAHSLISAFDKPDDLQARSGMSFAAMLSGITLANAGLGLSHGFAQPLGSLFPTPHGVVCAGLMGVINRKTVEKLRQENPNSESLIKYGKVGKICCDGRFHENDSCIDYLLDTIDQMIEKFGIPKFGTFGVTAEHVSSIISLTGHKNHPVKFAEDELESILISRI